LKTPLLSHQKNVFVARDGKVIGEFNVLQLPSLMETGSVLPTDYCYDASASEWILLPQFVEKTKFFKARPLEPAVPQDKQVQTIAGEKHKKRFNATLSGWIACLLAIVALGASIVWIGMLDDKLAAGHSEVAELRGKLKTAKEDYQRLSFSYREIADPGVIRGSIINRNDEGVRSAMPGMKVQIYPRDTIQAFLTKRYNELPQGAVASLSPDDLLKHFLTGMPEPLTTTVTDASGRYEFNIQKKGEYVVYTSVTTPGQGSRVWFLAVDSADPLNTPVDITDSNYVRDFIPDLMIAEGR
jgi:hypothetical protein